MIQKVFFLYLASVCVLVSVLTVTRRNVMHAVLFMLLLFFHVAGLYLFLNAEFLAAIQIIIYAGAIMVLFLFVVMLLNLREDEKSSQYIRQWPVGLVVALSAMFVFVMATFSLRTGEHGVWSIDRIRALTHTSALGRIMFTQYLLPFEIASMILLVAIVGAIVLAKKRLKG
ncbi:MAG: NADH-quinone oxidoreductase subunit J [Nitrospirae bacterium]|uniref:NADH-quinone oxidoreductase subunit J family protein n=1 Tax=Candidatus Magnetobacterium casense TaxID=1455061 RepID=UPI0006982D5C|nr:NADH-quinone oxidoreductase subunit J [Candidatus Magnetobacterium casensis]MBF0337186.1 NADH-quinone oxidoreductase subunit J [Nitrospirota bacterium]